MTLLVIRGTISSVQFSRVDDDIDLTEMWYFNNNLDRVEKHHNCAYILC